jgi:hypothetical protein
LGHSLTIQKQSQMKKINLILLSLFLVGTLSRCTTSEEINSSVPQNDTDKSKIEGLVQNYYDFKYTSFTEQTNKNAKMTKETAENFISNNELVTETNKFLKESKGFEGVNGVKINDSNVRTKLKANTFVISGNEATAKVEVCYYYLRVNPNDKKEEIESAGYDIFDLKFKKETDGTWRLSSEKQDMNYNGTYEIEPPKIKDVSSNSNLRAAAGYSSTNSTNWAKQYWQTPPSSAVGYTNYESLGGDCTNFVSWALRKGGWISTNNWFFNQDGSSCFNMNTCSRSPSWTDANYFNQYLRDPNKGGSRVTASFTNLSKPSLPCFVPFACDGYYNEIVKLGLGDLVQLGSVGSAVHHTMIVTSRTGSRPYLFLTYRNSSGNSPQLNKPIDQIQSNDVQQGFRVTGVL